MFSAVFANKLVVAFLRQHSEIKANFAETFISIINSQLEPLFGARSEHAIGFIHTLSNKIINQDCNISGISLNRDRLLPMNIPGRVDPGNDSLSACFLIASSAIDLTGVE